MLAYYSGKGEWIRHVGGEELDGFIAFFKSLILTDDLNEVFKSFADSVNAKHYDLILSPLLFQHAAYNYITQFCMGEGRRLRREELLSEAMKRPGVSLKKARKHIKKEINGLQALKIRNLHQTFMMIDKYPENEERFEFDAVKFERDVRKRKTIM